ncbi:MAG: hypothetical protein JWQ63_1971 [Mucilaginibacter sp.]|nr:hypothetical protein [Mucilaginibacter sp.]
MKSLKVYLIIAGLLLAAYIIAQLNRPKTTNWVETFSSKEKTPFGTYILFNRLKDLFPNARIIPYHQPVYNVIAEDSIKEASYIIVCGDIELSKSDYKQLIKYIERGNDVFIAAEYFGKLLDKNLSVKTDFKYNRGNIPVNFVSPYLNPKKHFGINKWAGNYYFSKFDTLNSVVLGENIDHKANFIRYTFGKGSLYLAANPKLFTNYSLLKPQGAEYAATALSYLKSTPQIAWDEYYTQGNTGDESPMRVFLRNPTLQWAYYIAIFSLLIFVLFEIKRRQRIIPVIEPLSNSTLEFVNVVGQVYYEKRNNANIAHKKILYLLEHLRDDYQLKTNKLDNEFIEKLSSKLGIESMLAYELVDYIKYIGNQQQVTDSELIELNKLIEKLYIQSR